MNCAESRDAPRMSQWYSKTKQNIAAATYTADSYQTTRLLINSRTDDCSRLLNHFQSNGFKVHFIDLSFVHRSSIVRPFALLFRSNWSALELHSNSDASDARFHMQRTRTNGRGKKRTCDDRFVCERMANGIRCVRCIRKSLRLMWMELKHDFCSQPVHSPANCHPFG